MKTDKRKLQKLTDMARLYYLQDMTQNEIAKLYGVSRPLISRMLREAKARGIVKIEICPPFDEAAMTAERAKELFGLEEVRAVLDGGNDKVTNEGIADTAVAYLKELHKNSIGIGWGHIIGTLVSRMEKQDPVPGLAYRVCPLIGNSGVGNRNYHSNELVRIFAQQCHGAPEYFYAPFIVTSEQEREIIEELESYQVIKKVWSSLDVALVNIGNYPSVPDFASEARYGDVLRKQKAVGKILNYYLDIKGNVFQSDTDYALQIPLDILRKIPYVVGICSANTSPKALIGALKTGLIHHLVAPEAVLCAAVDLESAEESAFREAAGLEDGSSGNSSFGNGKENEEFL